MHRVAYLCGAGSIACALFIVLTACGGGECDTSCQHDLAQAQGHATILPVECEASGACE